MTVDDIIFCVIVGINALIGLFNLVTGGRYKKFTSEVQKLLTYRSADYRTNPQDIDKGTVFSNLVPQFRLNKATGCLEEAEPLDVTALANSARNVELKSLLSKLEAGTAELSEQLKTQYEDYSDTLDDLANVLDVAEDYRAKFGLSDDVSVDDVFKRVAMERDKLKTSLDTIMSAQNKTKSEVKDNAQEAVQTQEPKVVS